MSDEPNHDSWIEIDGDEVFITDDAPDHIQDLFEQNTELAELIVRYGMAVSASDIKEPPALIHAGRVVERERQKVEEAVEQGDIESAQRHKTVADSVAKIRREYSEWLQDGGSE